MLLSRPQGAVQNMSDAMFEEAAECALCDKKFHAFRRKHRCRVRLYVYQRPSYLSLSLSPSD